MYWRVDRRVQVVAAKARTARRRADFRSISAEIVPSAVFTIEESANRAREDVGFVLDLLPGATGYPPARELKALLSPAIVEEGAIGVMEAAAVGFDDEAGLSP